MPRDLPAPGPRRSVGASLAWNYGAHLLVFVVTIGSTVIVSRLLTPRELGIFGVGAAISGILGTISYFGVANYLIREQHLEPATRASCFTVNALLSLAVGVMLWLIGSTGTFVFSDPAIGAVLRLMAWVPVIGLFEFLPTALLTREENFRAVSLVQLGKASANALAVIAFAYLGWGALSPAVGALAGAGFGALAFTVAGRRHVSWQLSLTNGREILVFAFQMISAGGVSVLAARIAELIVAQMLGLSALGLYTRASGLAAMVWDGAYGLSTRVIYVRMASELREKGTLKQTFLHATRLLTAIMWPAMAGLAVLAAPVVHLLYGPQWSGAALPLAVLMVGQFIAIGFAMNWELCVLTGRTGWQARIEVTRALAGLAGFALGALASLPAAAAGRIVDAVLGYAIYRPRMGEMAGAGDSEVRQAYKGSLLLAATAIAPAVAVMALHGWSPDTEPALITVAVLAGLGLWAATLRAHDHPLYRELTCILGSSAEPQR